MQIKNVNLKSLAVVAVVTSIVLGLSSCFVLKPLLGIKRAKQIDEQKALKYLKKNKIDSVVFHYHVNYACVSDSIKSINRDSTLHYYPFDFLLFDEEGHLKASVPFCELTTIDTLLSEFPPPPVIPVNTKFLLRNEMACYYKYKHSKTYLLNESRNGYTVVLKYVDFAGLPGKIYLKKIRNYINRYKNEISTIVFVNANPDKYLLEQ